MNAVLQKNLDLLNQLVQEAQSLAALYKQNHFLRKGETPDLTIKVEFFGDAMVVEQSGENFTRGEIMGYQQFADVHGLSHAFSNAAGSNYVLYTPELLDESLHAEAFTLYQQLRQDAGLECVSFEEWQKGRQFFRKD